jgi:hypothetical protein
MAEQSRPDPSDMEPAEGSRETVNANLDENHGERDRFKDADGKSTGDEARGNQGGGITNRPLREEIEEQRELPQRGNAKEDR